MSPEIGDVEAEGEDLKGEGVTEGEDFVAPFS